MECRVAYLRPGQIQERLAAVPVAYLPIGPLEWHGPHLPYGVDPLNAEHTALAVCARTGGLVWPTQFWGTERERSDAQLQSLGLPPGQYIVGMDFPAHSLPSAYCQEEVFALVIRELLRQMKLVGVERVVIINGHGATNHGIVLHRLAAEMTHAGLPVHVRMAMPLERIKAGSIGHASSDETSLVMHLLPGAAELRELPPLDVPLSYERFGIVDGPGFDGAGPADKAVPAHDAPRRQSSAQAGQSLFDQTVGEIAREVRNLLASAGS